MAEQLITYNQVADQVGLAGRQKKRYIAYMRTRFLPEEKLNCKFGYAQEWAQRFINHTEYSYSDREGQKVLEKIDKVF